MLIDQNSEIERGIKGYLAEYKMRHLHSNMSNGNFRNEEKERYKAQRAKTYEEKPPVNPSNLYEFNGILLSTRVRFTKFRKLYNVDHPYFDKSLALEQKIKIIHSSIVIQNAYRNYRDDTVVEAAIVIQKNIRRFLAERVLIHLKIQKVRKIYYLKRLEHWFLLLANKFREKKSEFLKRDYRKLDGAIVKIQSLARG